MKYKISDIVSFANWRGAGILVRNMSLSVGHRGSYPLDDSCLLDCIAKGSCHSIGRYSTSPNVARATSSRVKDKSELIYCRPVNLSACTNK